jgi:stage II sporulation protein D
VDRLVLTGGEPVLYHLSAAGRIDFLEAGLPERIQVNDGRTGHGLWRQSIGSEELRSRLTKAKVNVGEIRNVIPLAYSESNRISEMEISGDRGKAVLKGRQIRSTFGLKDDLAVVDVERDPEGRIAGVVFTGRGWGHGVGMCQLGAYDLARRGRSYAEILRTYYQGIDLREVY